MIKLDVSTVTRTPELHHFFYQCGCEYDLRFDWLDQSRKCPKCGEVVRLSEEFQEYLRRQRQETTEELKESAERIRRGKA